MGFVTKEKFLSKDFFITYAWLLGGCFVFALGAVMFAEPYGFAPGGTYGLSMVFHHLWGWETEIAALCMDVPLLLLGIYFLGGMFGVKTIICTFAIPAFMRLIHYLYGYDALLEPGITDRTLLNEQLLSAIFGGIVYGIGIGMIFKARATSGGSDIISMILNKYTHISLGTLVIIVDCTITLSTVVAFGDWRLPMYSWIIVFIEGKVIDLVFPIVVLIIFCICGMLYTGGFFSGTGFVKAFSASDASVGLMLGSFFALVVTVVFYALRKVLKFRESMECVPEGFKAMVPAILILTFAWTLKAMTDSLGAAEYVANVMQSAAGGLLNFLPAIIFLVGCFLAFATGTSWGTFGILIPIVVAVFQGTNETMMIISISACMAGAVCGDHCSPISDTTIMASAGAQCNHVNHVTTQLPYAATVAVVSCITYVIAGFVQNALICLPIGMVLLAAALLFMKKRTESHS